jgi:hypothetical protein
MKSSIPGPVGDLNGGRVLLEVEVRDEVETEGSLHACHRSTRGEPSNATDGAVPESAGVEMKPGCVDDDNDPHAPLRSAR